MRIGEITLEKLENDNSYTTVTTLKNPLSGSASYFYTDSSCFDGAKDICLEKEPDPLFTLAFSASGSLVNIPSPEVDTASNSGNISKPVRKNITSIVRQDF